jgi:UDP-glucose 4-epimerase
LRYWEENINATLSLISVMEENNCRNIVFSSSATIYKPILGFKLTEDSIKEPINPYGNSKLAIEKIFHDVYNLNKNWKIINLRYFNPVGVHNSANIGEVQLGTVTNLFPILEKVVSCKLDRLMIYGKDWPTFDGTCVRDYIHVMDLAEAHLLALDRLSQNQLSDVYNVGNNEGFSVREIIEVAEKVTNQKMDIEIQSRRKGDPAELIADNQKIKSELNWKAKHSDLDKIISSAWQWEQKLLTFNQ